MSDMLLKWKDISHLRTSQGIGWEAIAKAQLIKAWDWLNGECTEHYPVAIHRYDCPQCRAEFEAEIKRLKEGKE